MSNLFLPLLSMSLTAGYSILAILVVRFLLQKTPKKYSYFLWSVVAFRLCCPMSFSSAFSLFCLRLPGMSPLLSEKSSAASAGISSGGGSSAAFGKFAPPQAWLALGIALWLAGAAALAACGLVSYIRLTGRLRTAVRLKDNVFQAEYVQSPFILGVIRPKIYIPYHLDSQTLHYVLFHENYHLERCDHILKIAAYLLLSLHWFNPLCWLAFHLFCKDMEMSCDEHVLGREEHSSGDYSEALLSVALRSRFPSPGPLAFGETDIQKRILHILDWKRPRPAAALISAVLCLAIVFVCASDPVAADLGDTDAPTSGILPDAENTAGKTPYPDTPNTDETAGEKPNSKAPDADETAEEKPNSKAPDADEAAEEEPKSDAPDMDDTAGVKSDSKTPNAGETAGDEPYSDAPDTDGSSENEYQESKDTGEYGDTPESHHSESHHSGHHSGE